MTTQIIQTCRWTCDRCATTHDQSEAGEDEIPTGWACVAVSLPDAEEPATHDLCPDCGDAVRAFLLPVVQA